jgi:hypothetical protein
LAVISAPEQGVAAAGRGGTRIPSRHRWWPRILLAAALLWLLLALWHAHKPLPQGVHVAGPWVQTPVASLRFLADLSSADQQGNMRHEKQIHPATLELIRNARDFLLLDYFLFNGSGGPKEPLHYGNGLAPVSAELIAALRELKLAQPSLPVLVLTDPINDYYRYGVPAPLVELEALGIVVVTTRLDPLRDSNPLYSTPWRMLGGPWLPTGGAGRIPNPLDAQGPPIRLGALLRLPNFKANHRKVVLTGDGAGSLIGIIASANPHDASSAHSNVALRVHGEALRALLASELAVARFSGWQGAGFAAFEQAASGAIQRGADAAVDGSVPGDSGGTRSAIATEGAIRAQLLERLDATKPGDSIDIAQFYLSDRKVVRALREAAQRGVAVRLLLDPNKDAFGFEKSGRPNREVAGELLASAGESLQLRWYRTHGEQFHAKLAAVRHHDRLWFTLGSANFTRRNLGDYNLEANVVVETPADSSLATDVMRWYETLWTNPPGICECSADADAWPLPGRMRYWLYRFMEGSGTSTF